MRDKNLGYHIYWIYPLLVIVVIIGWPIHKATQIINHRERIKQIERWGSDPKYPSSGSRRIN